ncbi:MAG: histidine--tRNA ligase [Leeuwenhoekiella sp.]
MAQKPSIPKGTRDFSPQEVLRRNHIIKVLRHNFELFGFQPIETPSFENTDTLLGKYGEEGDRLIFKILNSGDFLSKTQEETYAQKDSNALATEITEKALRYDLTVPFARYVVQHQNELEFPFKRYQMQLVWRADRPQKGRFREFLQCDADAVGSDSLIQEVTFIQLYDAVFGDLGLDGVTINMNNRKILSGIAEVIGASDKLIDFTVALDKLDKIGEEGVVKEMLSKGISEEAIDKIRPIFRASGSNTERLDLLRKLLQNSKTGMQGIEEISYIFDKIEQLGLKSAKLALNITLARGLNYYTGAIFEVSAPEGVQMGSIGGGGRYDDLTGIFGLKNMSGVGISFGVDRIYLVLEELGLFPEQVSSGTKVLFLNFGEKEAFYCLKAVAKLRENGIKAEVYPDSAKMKKQMTHADRRDIKYVVLAGDQEMAKNVFTLKDMKSGEQQEVNLKELTAHLQS